MRRPQNFPLFFFDYLVIRHNKVGHFFQIIVAFSEYLTFKFYEQNQIFLLLFLNYSSLIWSYWEEKSKFELGEKKSLYHY